MASGGGGGSDAASTALVASSAKRAAVSSDALIEVPRTSDLFAPIVRLEGHSGAVNGVRFSPDGQNLVSVSSDKTIQLWRVFGDAPDSSHVASGSSSSSRGGENYGTLKGHTNSVQEGIWTEDGLGLVTCSADKTVRLWDCVSGEEVSLRKDHRAFVNCCAISPLGSTVASGGDDCHLRLWDPREGLQSFAWLKHPFEVTCCVFSPTSASTLIHTGSVDGIVRTWDVRKPIVLFSSDSTPEGLRMPNVVTGLACGLKDELVSIASSGLVQHWDVRPFVGPGETSRLKHSFSMSNGAPLPANKGLLLLRADVSSKQDRVATGSSSPVLPIWELESGDMEFALPGHKGPVLDARFHPTQPIVASCSVDKCIFLGELDQRAV